MTKQSLHYQRNKRLPRPEFTLPIQLTKNGFTLIELLVVLVILGIFVAMMAQVFMKSDDQRRFDETRVRMDEIKKALLGPPGAYVYGQRQFAGYITDIGGLPTLNADDQPESLWEQGSLPDWEYKAALKIWMGWRGPYLETPPRGDNILRDGWGNALIFTFLDSPSNKELRITSYGTHNLPGDGSSEYDKDISIDIKRTQYEAPVAGRVKTGYIAPVTVTLYIPVNGVVTPLNPTPNATTGHQLDTDGYFRFENGASGAPGSGTYNGDIPVGLRSIDISDNTLPPRTLKIVFTAETTGNWLGDINIP